MSLEITKAHLLTNRLEPTLTKKMNKSGFRGASSGSFSQRNMKKMHAPVENPLETESSLNEFECDSKNIVAPPVITEEMLDDS